MKQSRILNRFGKLFISMVRDESIEKFEMICLGKVRSKQAIEKTNKLSRFSKEEVSLIRELIISSIDDSLHNFLWTLEQNEEELSLLVKDIDGSSENLVEISDGLSGELYTEDGWIARFSKYKEDC